MRITLSSEDDAFSTAQAYAAARAIKLSTAVSELTRRSSLEKMPFKQTGGMWVLDLPANTPTATQDQFKALLEEGA